MAAHHDLSALSGIGETLWYVATWRGRWLAPIGLSAAALKCGVRERWIGWDCRTQFDRLKLIANHSRFLILPEDIRRHFAQLGEADYTEPTRIAHGRIETRSIWTSIALNDSLDFPDVGQTGLIKRTSIDKNLWAAATSGPSVLPAARRSNARPSSCWRSIAATGASKAGTPSSTGTMTRISAASAPATAPLTSRTCTASRSACSNPSRNRIRISLK